MFALERALCLLQLVFCRECLDAYHEGECSVHRLTRQSDSQVSQSSPPLLPRAQASGQQGTPPPNNSTVALLSSWACQVKPVNDQTPL